MPKVKPVLNQLNIIASDQPPYDAFWGARYAVVRDPDGNDVGIMSPLDDGLRSWPPVDSSSR